MKALEFMGKKDAKGSIKIPKEIQSQLEGEFRVIILQESSAAVTKTPSRKKRALSAPKIKTKGFKFNRDEANAR